MEDKRLVGLLEEESEAHVDGIASGAIKLDGSKLEEKPEGVSTSATWRNVGSPST